MTYNMILVVCMCIHIVIHIHICVYIYIYIYTEETCHMQIMRLLLAAGARSLDVARADGDPCNQG